RRAGGHGSWVGHIAVVAARSRGTHREISRWYAGGLARSVTAVGPVREAVSGRARQRDRRRGDDGGRWARCRAGGDSAGVGAGPARRGRPDRRGADGCTATSVLVGGDAAAARRDPPRAR